MSDIRIRELSAAQPFVGTELFLNIPANATTIALNTLIYDMQLFSLSVNFDINVTGNMSVTSSLTADVLTVTGDTNIQTISANSVVVYDTLSLVGDAEVGNIISQSLFDVTDGQILSAGTPLEDTLVLIGNLDDITDTGNTTTSAITANAINSTGNISTSTDFISGGTNLSDAFVQNINGVSRAIALYQAEFDAIVPDPTTLYFIIDPAVPQAVEYNGIPVEYNGIPVTFT